MTKQRHPARLALAKAIESKVERMNMAGLLELANVLKVPIPGTAKAVVARERKPSVRPAKRAEKILQGGGVGPVVSASEGHKLLDAITVDDQSEDWIESEVVGAGVLVERLSISRGTLDNWRKAHRIVALRKGPRNFVYPLRQFDRRGPVPGLETVAPFFPSAEELWEWLVAPNRMVGGKPPIDVLRDGDVPAVTGAAKGAFDFS